MKRIFSTLLICILLISAVSASGFEKVNVYGENTFSDVASNAWYASDVKSSYEFGLVNGVGGGRFDPNGTVTVSQAITLASRFASSYYGEEIPASEGEWYKAYVDYAVSKGIIKDGEFDSYTRAAKRHEVASLFAASLPKESFKAFNSVESIPDVTSDKSYYESLMTLYRSGIAMGSDAKGTFNPDANITRAEFSALINRVASPGMRLAKSFDTMPQTDPYILIDAPGMSYTFSNGMFSLPNGWLCDNKNAENITNGALTVSVADDLKEDYTALYRDFDKVNSGRLLLEFNGKLFSADDGIYIGFADENGNVNAGVQTDAGYLSVVGSEKHRTQTKVSADTPEEYTIILTVDFDNSEIYAFVNGVMTDTFALAEDISVQRLIIGSTKEGTGYIAPESVKLYHNYALAETFLANDKASGNAPYTMNVSGNITLEEYPTNLTEDIFSAKVDAKAGEENVASKSFARVYGKGIFEAYVMLPEYRDGAYFAITGANSEVLRIYSKDKAWYVNDTKVRDYTENVWQILRIETDTDANKAIVKICGKTVGEFDISAEYVDGLKIGINTDKDGIMWFDDITAKAYIDHEDYPEEPKANNDDEYNVGIHVCNLWHDSVTGEGWQAVSPFAELEPIYGFYDEGSAELADWEIKAMAEHGIDFQNFCWYPTNYVVTYPIKIPEDSAYAIHDGYFNAKYSDLVKFCIMWENANMKKSTLSDFKEYIWKYWKEYYFTDSRYQVVDNKPILTIWSYSALVDYFGDNQKVKEAFDFMREDIKTLGFDDIIILIRKISNTENAVAIGADAMYYYHYSQDGFKPDTQINTLNADKSNVLHVIPTLAIGHNGIGRYDERTPLISLENHKKVAEYIKDDYLASKNTGTWMDNTLFVSTWNEYSEGHYIAPSGDFGYGYLETIKDVFTNDTSDHTAIDVIPTEAQKDRITKMYPDTHQPIRVLRIEDSNATAEMKTIASWNFANANDLAQWNTLNIDSLESTGTGVEGYGATIDPQFANMSLNLDISSKPVVHVRMMAAEQSNLNLFFKTEANDTLEGNVKVKRATLMNLGQYVDYYLDLSDNKEWTGTLKGLRFDPVGNMGKFGVELIELLVPAADEISVTANTNTMTFDFPAVMNGGDVEVTANPKLGFFTMLNLYHTWNRYTGTLYVESKTHTLEMTVGKNTAFLDGKEVNLGYTFSLRDGLPVIRLSKFCEMLGHKALLSDGKLEITSTDKKTVSIVKGDYIGWDFDIAGNTEEWRSYNTVITAMTGKLHITAPTMADIHLFPPEIEINADKYTKLAIGLTANPADLEGKSFQMFFAESGMGYTEARSVRHKYDTSVMKNGELYEFVIDLSENDKWTGNISKFRVDFYNAQVECAVDYFRFIEDKNYVEEEKTTTEPEVVLPQVTAETAVYAWDMNSEDEAKYGGGDSVLSFENGMAALTNPQNADVQFYLRDLEIDASKVSKITIGIKANNEVMADKTMQVFFITDTATKLDEQKCYRHRYDVSKMKDGEVYPVTIDLTSNAEWKGTVTRLRIDAFNSQSDVYIDYVYLW